MDLICFWFGYRRAQWTTLPARKFLVGFVFFAVVVTPVITDETDVDADE